MAKNKGRNGNGDSTKNPNAVRTYIIPVPKNLNYGQLIAIRQGLSRLKERKGFTNTNTGFIIKDNDPSNDGYWIRGTKEQAESYLRWIQKRARDFQYSSARFYLEERENGWKGKDYIELSGVEIPPRVLDEMADEIASAYQGSLDSLAEENVSLTSENNRLKSTLEKSVSESPARNVSEREPIKTEDSESDIHEKRVAMFERTSELYSWLMAGGHTIDEVIRASKTPEEAGRESAQRYLEEKRGKKLSPKYLDGLLSKANEAKAFKRRIRKAANRIDRLKKQAEEKVLSPVSIFATGILKELGAEDNMIKRFVASITDPEFAEITEISKRLEKFRKREEEYSFAMEVNEVYEGALKEQNNLRSSCEVELNALQKMRYNSVPVDVKTEESGDGMRTTVEIPHIENGRNNEFLNYLHKIFSKLLGDIGYTAKPTGSFTRVVDVKKGFFPRRSLEAISEEGRKAIEPLGLRLSLRYSQD